MRPPRLLAVDDDPPSAELIARIAERCGFESYATSDSRGVIHLVAALQPDVVAVDIAMPHVDAVELFRQLVQQRYPGEIIIVSGQDEQMLATVKHVAQAMGLLCNHAHQKPINYGRMREALDVSRFQGNVA